MLSTSIKSVPLSTKGDFSLKKSSKPDRHEIKMFCCKEYSVSSFCNSDKNIAVEIFLLESLKCYLSI